ncbi:MAG: hypothetical protein AABZ10_00330 [Nitrospirota bacterium]
MRITRHIIILLLLLFTLPSCGPLRSLAFSVAPPYTEPAEGPRAKIRVVYQGAMVRFYPGETCFNRDNEGAGVAGPYAGFVRCAKRLDMPLQPKKGKFDEFYVKANEPIAVSFYYKSETLTRPDQKMVEECGPVGYLFTPGENALYETKFEFVSRRYCGFVLEKIVKDETGDYQKQPLHGVPASSCPKQKDAGASTPGAPGDVTLPPATGERERRYY